MTLIDLSYALSETDKSIWPGNLSFSKETISEGHVDDAGCFIAIVRPPLSS